MKKAFKILTAVVVVGAIGRKVYRLYKDGYFDDWFGHNIEEDFDFEDDLDEDLDD